MDSVDSVGCGLWAVGCGLWKLVGFCSRIPVFPFPILPVCGCTLFELLIFVAFFSCVCGDTGWKRTGRSQ